jgi:hypothetical protein
MIWKRPSILKILLDTFIRNSSKDMINGNNKYDIKNRPSEAYKPHSAKTNTPSSDNPSFLERTAPHCTPSLPKSHVLI